ncbi:YidH family protein [Lysobacter soli]|uniref:YidH family protein n=1 Tax=Lysobacter soli TaxID=453783 RepID=UPI0036A2B5BE
MVLEASSPPPLPKEVAVEIEGQADAATCTTKLSVYRTRLSVYGTHVANLRSHLANERTQLSYLRTTVSLIGFGITLNRFSMYLLQQNQTPRVEPMLRDSGNAGVGMVVLGLPLLLWSIYRYWRVGADIERGQYVARQKGTLVASLGLFLLGGLTAAWLFFR